MSLLAARLSRTRQSVLDVAVIDSAVGFEPIVELIVPIDHVVVAGTRLACILLVGNETPTSSVTIQIPDLVHLPDKVYGLSHCISPYLLSQILVGISIGVHRLTVPDDVAVLAALYDGKTRSGIISRWSTTLVG